MKNRFLIPLLLVVIPLLVWGRVGRLGFVGWDDDIHVYNNPYLNPPTIDSALHFWKGPHEAMYIPLTFTAWAVIAKANRIFSPAGILSPGLFHWANLLVHLLNVGLVYCLLLRLLSGFAASARERGAAALGALLFALHPLQVEPVLWISSLKDLLCGFFSLLALLQYLSYCRDVRINTVLPIVNRSKRKGHAFVATLAFVLALLSKPAAVPVPALAFLLANFQSPQRSPFRGIKSFFKAPWGLLWLWLIMVLPIIFMARYSEKGIPLGFVASPGERIFIALDALAFYLSKLLFPCHLTIDYGRTPAQVLKTGWLYFAWLFPVGLAAGLLFLKERRQWLVALSVFVIGVSPTLGLVPHGYQVFSTVADRFCYLGLLGGAIALAWFYFRARGKIVRSGCFILIGLLALGSYAQKRHWRDNVSLFSHALTVNQRSYMAHYNLGLTLADDHRARAITHYRAALKIKPDYARAWNNLGVALAGEGKIEEAITAYREAIRLQPTNRQAYYNLGLALAGRKEYQEAIRCYQKALFLRPRSAETHNSLGQALAGAGRRSEAIFQYSKAIELNPDDPRVRNNLGIVLADQGDLPGAISQYRQALRINPDFAAVHSNLGNSLTDAGRAEEALRHYRRAVELQPDYAMGHNNLGAALARRGELKAAAREFSAALRLDPNLAEARSNLSHLKKDR